MYNSYIGQAMVLAENEEIEMKKITLATVKSFIKNNQGNLQILTKSRFDGMIDGCANTGEVEFSPVRKTENNDSHTLGIKGAWFVGSSRDYFTEYNENGFIGIEISNCCGHFTLAVAH